MRHMAVHDIAMMPQLHACQTDATLMPAQAEPVSNEEEYSKFASSSDRSHVTVGPPMPVEMAVCSRW